MVRPFKRSSAESSVPGVRSFPSRRNLLGVTPSPLLRFGAGMIVLGTLYLIAPNAVRADTIRITPADSYAAIEAARAGDEVIVEPGTYRFRVFLTESGTAEAPIVIRAADPNDPPVWDLSDDLVENHPGSSTRGDRGRGCWQVTGDHYEISGLVIRGCHTASVNAAGIRAIGTDHLTVRDVLFDSNEVGLSGDGEDTVVEYCEFVGNGVRSSPPQHSIYIYGGSFTLRYSYVHDTFGGQNLHIRARTSTIEYNWIARAWNYEADMMTGPDDHHEMLFRGNVLVTHPSPENSGQVFAMVNDAGRDGVSMHLRILWNTIIVQGDSNPRLVNLRNDGLASVSVEISNNVIVGTTRLVDAHDEMLTNWSLAGGSNHVPSGADASGLSDTLFGDDPGFAAGANNFRPRPDSPLAGAADLGISPAPAREYAEDEVVALLGRARPNAADIGALGVDSTGATYGAYSECQPAECGMMDAGPLGDGGSVAGATGARSGGCQVHPGRRHSEHALLAWLFVLLAMGLRRSRSARVNHA